MWSTTQKKAFDLALAVAAKHAEALALLTQLAKYAPAFAERIEAAETERQNLHQIGATALAISAS